MKTACILALALTLALALAGCATKPRASVGNVRALGLPHQDLPAQVERTQETLPLPKGSTVEARIDGTRLITLAEPSALTTARETASTGGVSAVVATHKIDSDRKATLARTQMLVGIGLMVAGVVLAFALPGPLRWPQAGIYVAATGLALVILRDPPTWLIAALAAATVACVIAYFSTAAQRRN